MLRCIRWCVVVLAVCWTVSAGAADFSFKDGDVIVLSGIPEWITSSFSLEELEAKKQKALETRRAKMQAMDAAVAETLAMKANRFEIVPVK
jgi:hypothetical protein